MVLSIAIVLILSSFLFLALKGLFGVFPDNWEWVGIVMAMVGIAMTTQSTLQTLWGRHLLECEFNRDVEDNIRFLSIFLKNPPIKNKVLRAFKVKRDTIQSLTVQFQIREAGSGTVIVPIRQARIISDADSTSLGRDRIALPPTYSIAASCMIAFGDMKNNKVFIAPNNQMSALEIEPGYYQVDLSIMVEGEPIYKSKRFVVGQSANDLIWSG